MDAFFSHNSATQAQCDWFAEQNFGGPAEPVSRPGSFSYTLIARTSEGKVVVQFRDKSSPLPDPDSPVVQQFGIAHHGLFPLHQRLGTVGELEVYSMPKLRGDPYSTVFNYFFKAPHKRMKLVGDLARFFASSWENASSCNIEPAGRARIAADCKSRLAHISGTLPPRFQSSVADAQRCLDNLFDPEVKYPLISTHGDFSENNLFVNKKTGEFTGVIDVAELSFLPFGFDFYGLEEIVGYLSLDGWGEHDGAQELRAHFWVTFANSAKLDPKGPEMQTIREARLVGILFRYGTRTDAGFSGMLGQFISQDPSSVAMLMLDGLVLRR